MPSAPVSAGQRRAAVRVPVRLEILCSCLAEALATEFQFHVEPLKDAEAEFAIAFNRNHARMGQMMRCVCFEFDALLKVDQVKLDLLWAVDERRIRD